jgi:hypothetical protein
MLYIRNGGTHEMEIESEKKDWQQITTLDEAENGNNNTHARVEI